MTVIDVGEGDFQAAVLDRSASMPVVVDFWAPWCAPCRALAPVLERAAAAREGAVVLARLDGDANPNLVRYFGVHGIPAVKAFRDGEVVDEFVGAQPPAAVERFFDAVTATQADMLIASGDESALRQALELQPRRSVAAVALARKVHEAGDSEAALQIVDRLPGSARARAAAARIRLERANPSPHLFAAFAALDAGEVERAVDLLLSALSSAGAQRENLRHVIAGVLGEVGVDHPSAPDWRRRLAEAPA